MFFNKSELQEKIKFDYESHLDVAKEISDLFANCSNFSNDYVFFCELNQLCKSFSPYAARAQEGFDITQKFAEDENKLQSLMKRLPTVEKGIYCDVGCGAGGCVVAAEKIGFEKALGIEIAERWKETHDSLESERVSFYSTLDESPSKYDLITSYSAFEHFEYPQFMLSNILSKLNKGGVFYTCFSPIYNSDDGTHMYPYIYIPWYQHLFSENIISRFIRENDLEMASKINYLNKWSALDWFLLFTTTKQSELKRIHPFWKEKNLFFLDIISPYLRLPVEEYLFRGFEVIYQKP